MEEARPIKIEVLGTGRRSCKVTLARIEKRAQALAVDVDLHKVEEIERIMSYGVMSTPAVVVDGRVVHVGGVPRDKKIDGWLR